MYAYSFHFFVSHNICKEILKLNKVYFLITSIIYVIRNNKRTIKVKILILYCPFILERNSNHVKKADYYLS